MTSVVCLSLEQKCIASVKEQSFKVGVAVYGTGLQRACSSVG
jgi:hypothetical protein